MHKAHIGVDAEPPLLNVAECIPTESTARMNVAGANTGRTVWLYLLKSFIFQQLCCSMFLYSTCTLSSSLFYVVLYIYT